MCPRFFFDAWPALDDDATRAKGKSMFVIYRRTSRIVLFAGLSSLFGLTRFPEILARSRVVHWDSAGLDGVKDNIGTKEDKFATTDATASFSLEMPPGVYDVFVAAVGFSPHCEKLTLKAPEMHRYEAD